MTDKKDLVHLLSDLISGKGIETYPTGDDEDKKIFAGCLELEKKGLIVRQADEPDCVLWILLRQKKTK